MKKGLDGSTLGTVQPFFSLNHQLEPIMAGHIKNAAITTAIVLASIYVLRMAGAGKIVDKAIVG